jgi:hypothetical protein
MLTTVVGEEIENSRLSGGRMIRSKYLSIALLLFSGREAIAQGEVRDLRPPVAVREPLTDTKEAARLFYLSLANMSATDRATALKNPSLNDSEVLAVSAAALNFKTAHAANSQAYAAQAMNLQNTDADLEAYKGRANAVLQQAQDVIFSSVSLNGSKKLATAIEKWRLGSHVYKYFLKSRVILPPCHLLTTTIINTR